MSARSLSSSTYDEILRRLLGGTLKPGQLFNRRELATELGVSVAPLLEALVVFECEGLIVTTPRKGTRVRTITAREMQATFIVRKALQCQAARLICGAAIESHARTLLRMAEQLDTNPPLSPADARRGIRFHHYLVAVAGVPALTNDFERVMKVHLLYTLQASRPATGGAARPSNVELVQALRTRDPDQAEAAMRMHLQEEYGALNGRESARASAEKPVVPAWLQD